MYFRHVVAFLFVTLFSFALAHGDEVHSADEYVTVSNVVGTSSDVSYVTKTGEAPDAYPTPEAPDTSYSTVAIHSPGHSAPSAPVYSPSTYTKSTPSAGYPSPSSNGTAAPSSTLKPSAQPETGAASKVGSMGFAVVVVAGAIALF